MRRCQEGGLAHPGLRPWWPNQPKSGPAWGHSLRTRVTGFSLTSRTGPGCHSELYSMNKRRTDFFFQVGLTPSIFNQRADFLISFHSMDNMLLNQTCQLYESRGRPRHVWRHTRAHGHTWIRAPMSRPVQAGSTLERHSLPIKGSFLSETSETSEERSRKARGSARDILCLLCLRLVT